MLPAIGSKWVLPLFRLSEGWPTHGQGERAAGIEVSRAGEGDAFLVLVVLDKL